MFKTANDRFKWNARSIFPLLFIASWWLPKLYNPHLAMDGLVANALQIPLKLYRPWQVVCAYLNTDLFDGAMYIAIISHTVFTFQRVPFPEKEREIKRFLLYYFVLSISQFAFKYLLHISLEYNRLSPSLTLTDGVRVPADMIGFYFKDISRRSFPGDHALFLFSWAMFWTKGYAKSISTSALIIASFFSIPRLLLGSHWLSDLTLGGILPAWIFAKLSLATRRR